MSVGKRWATSAACCACATLMVACGSVGDDERDNATPPAVAPASSSAAADVQIVPIEDRLVARLDISGGPDYLATTDDAIWIKTDSGMVIPVDPETGKPGKGIEVSDVLCQGLGSADDGLWTCSGETGDIVRIDAVSGKVSPPVAAGKINVQGQIPVAFDHAWVLVDDGSQLAKIAGNAVETTTDLGTVCTQLAASATGIWAACPDGGLAVKVDPATGEVAGRVADLPGADAIAAGEQVWVGFEGGVARIDDATVATTAVAQTGVPGYGAGLTVASDAVWLRTEGRFLRRIDPATAAVIEEIQAPEKSSGSVLVAFGSIWATAYDDEVLYRLDPS